MRRCVFCQRTPEEVTWFIAGPEPDGPGICEECLGVCRSIVKEMSGTRYETAAERYARLAPLAAAKWAKALAGRP